MKLLISLFTTYLLISSSVSSKLKSQDPEPKDTDEKPKEGEEAKNEEEESARPDDELIPPPTNGNFVDFGSYHTLNWLSKGGEPDSQSLIFFAKAYFAESYIFFKEDHTQNEQGDSGSQLEESSFLFAPDSHGAFLPYYYIEGGDIGFDSQTETFVIKMVDTKINPLFSYTAGVKTQLNLAPVDFNVIDNQQFVLQNMKDKIYTAFLIYNQRVNKIQLSVDRMKVLSNKIRTKKAELDGKNRNGMFEYYNAKAEIVRLTLNPGMDMILGELEDKEVKVEVGAARLCDNLYINGEFDFFRSLMGTEEWDRVKGDYDPILDTSAGHSRGNASPSEAKSSASEGDDPKEGGETDDKGKEGDGNHEGKKKTRRIL